MATTDPIRNKEDVKALLNYYRERKNYRNYFFIGLGVYSALRVGDMLVLKWGMVYDFQRDMIKSHISLVEQKTRKPKKFPINDHLSRIMAEYKFSLEQRGLAPTPDTYLFPSQKGDNKPIGRERAYCIIRDASIELGIPGVIGCHSLRKTFGCHSYKSGVSPILLTDLYNHSSFHVTLIYLGIEQEERDKAYYALNFE